MGDMCDDIIVTYRHKIEMVYSSPLNVTQIAFHILTEVYVSLPFLFFPTTKKQLQ